MQPPGQPVPVIPELYVSDIARSTYFYTAILGFRITYQRREEQFVMVQREHAQIMLEQPTGRIWLNAPLEHPYGRGMNLQIGVRDAAALFETCVAQGVDIFLPLEDKWYRRDGDEVGNRQFIVPDPDGYLLRFAENLGLR